eukprot:TRINITY_DN3937_c0_g1_i1.p1 TRINITY_DN3937_c0_g1~~TRINITY_DN3937_c0_g1_i1.p1  ORF type:complete len:122 (+),score=16.34 TRINITY_DN3937_c0_g1_i1:2-367(+)
MKTVKNGSTAVPREALIYCMSRRYSNLYEAEQDDERGDCKLIVLCIFALLILTLPFGVFFLVHLVAHLDGVLSGIAAISTVILLVIFAITFAVKSTLHSKEAHSHAAQQKISLDSRNGSPA